MAYLGLIWISSKNKIYVLAEVKWFPKINNIWVDSVMCMAYFLNKHVWPHFKGIMGRLYFWRIKTQSKLNTPLGAWGTLNIICQYKGSSCHTANAATSYHKEFYISLTWQNCWSQYQTLEHTGLAETCQLESILQLYYLNHLCLFMLA